MVAVNGLNVFVDGASFKDKGMVVIRVMDSDKNIIFEKCEEVEGKTNNQCEYFAVLKALEWLEKEGKFLDYDIRIYSDSLLVVNQIKGEYEVNVFQLRYLRNLILEKMKKFKNIEVIWKSKEEKEMKEIHKIIHKEKKKNLGGEL